MTWPDSKIWPPTRMETLSTLLKAVRKVLTTLPTMGTAGERMMVGSVVNTFLTAFDKVDKVSILVSGQIFESGHVVYDEPMEFFE